MIILCVIGTVFVLLGLDNIISSFIINKSCSQKVEGELIRINEQDAYDRYRPHRGVCYSATYKYIVNDIEYTFTPKKFVDDPQWYEIGSKAELKYNPKNPEMCILKRSDKIGLGILCVIIGLTVLFFAFR